MQHVSSTCIFTGQSLTREIDNTNSKHLELYSIMGEYDNAGFPMTYCLLSTATAIELGKRKLAIAAWSQCLRDKYGVKPVFIHTDKDMGEIGTSKDVWEAKINLCWWHLRQAVRTRLVKAKLSTSPYNLDRARAEYDFIKPDFIPAGMRVDINDYEGGTPDDELPSLVNGQPSLTVIQHPASQPSPATLILTATTPSSVPDPNSQSPHEPPTAQCPTQLCMPLGDTTNLLRIKLLLPSIASALGRVIRGAGFRLSIPAMLLPTIEEQKERDEEERTINEEREVSVTREDEDGDKQGRRTFCPALYRDTIINMMERHYCAHPLIPGSSPPDAKLIKKWAVQRMYDFCSKHELPEVWVYLWENWYREGRWELWARCAHKIIPVLKTTMILESQ